MTALGESAPTSQSDPEADGFEVATTAADQLRASVRVCGRLGLRTVPLLLSVLRTHVRAGRRHLRVDLAAAAVDDLAVLAPLRDAHDRMAELGGLLVFDNADESACAALRDRDAFVAVA